MSIEGEEAEARGCGCWAVPEFRSKKRCKIQIQILAMQIYCTKMSGWSEEFKLRLKSQGTKELCLCLTWNWEVRWWFIRIPVSWTAAQLSNIVFVT